MNKIDLSNHYNLEDWFDLFLFQHSIELNTIEKADWLQRFMGDHDTIEELEDKIDNLESELKECEEEKEDLESDKQHLEEMVSDLEEEILDLKREIEQLETGK